jgi:hypothetical protein
VWCIYPSPRPEKRREPLFKRKEDEGKEQYEYFRVRNDVNADDFARELRQETRYPGRTIVLGKLLLPLLRPSLLTDAACGDEDFMRKMRDKVLANSTPRRVIALAQVEYRPHLGGRPMARVGTSLFDSSSAYTTFRASSNAVDVEMQNIVVGGRALGLPVPPVKKPGPVRRAAQRTSRLA